MVTIKNTGRVDVTTPVWTDELYLSSDETFDVDDVSVGTELTIPSQPLAVGESYSFTKFIQLSDATRPFLLVATDRFESVPEQNEANNIVAQRLTIAAPDLAVVSGTLPMTATLGQNLSVSAMIENRGNSPTVGTWSDSLFLSDDAVFDVGDQYLAGFFQSGEPALAVAESYAIDDVAFLSQNLPAGDRFLLLVVDAFQQQPDSDRANNVVVQPVHIQGPDLALSVENSTASVVLGENVHVDYRVTNIASSDAIATWGDYVYLSDDDVLSPDDSFLYAVDPTQGGLPAGESYTRSVEFLLPAFRTPGSKFLIIQADGWLAQGELGEANNVVARPIRIDGPDLTVTSAAAPQSVNLGDLISISYVVTNSSPTKALADWYDGFYLSADALLDGNDQLIDSEFVMSQSPLAGGDSYTVTRDLQLPGNAPSNRFLLFVTDAFASQGETNEQNNVRAVPLQGQRPDLLITASTSPAIATLGGPIDITYTVTNQGEVPALADWFDGVYLSTDATFDPTDTLLLSESVVDQTPLASAAKYDVARSFTLPQYLAAGQYKLLFVTDGGDAQGEEDEANNVRAADIAIIASDLTITAVTAPGSVDAGASIPVSYSVSNTGTGTAFGLRQDLLVLSTDDILDAGDVQLATIDTMLQSPLAPSGSYSKTLDVVVPAHIGPGAYKLLAIVDSSRAVGESNENNNVFVSPLQVTAPDLTVLDLTAPDAASVSQTVELTWTVRNIGLRPALGDWNDAIYLSSDDKLDVGTDLRLTAVGKPDGSPLLAGAEYSRSVQIEVPNVALGTWHLLLKTDDSDEQGETNEANNLVSRAIQITQTDLVPIEFIVPGNATLDQTIGVTWNVKNLGPGPAPNDWRDAVYLSANDVVDAGDIELASWLIDEPTPLAADGVYSLTRDVRIPSVAPGEYKLLIVVDALRQQGETDETNNLLARTIVIGGPDLVPLALHAPTNVTFGNQFVVTWEVMNEGNGPATQGWLDDLWLSVDQTVDANDLALGSFGGSRIDPNASYSREATISLPADDLLSGGEYFLLLRTDAREAQTESNEANNLMSVSITVAPFLPPDLQVTAVTHPATIPSADSVRIDFHVSNAGTAVASGPWTDSIFLSPDGTLANAFEIHATQRLTNLLVGQGYDVSELVSLPAVAAGSYRLLVATDARDVVIEGSRNGNNLFVSPQTITVVAPDLVVSANTTVASAESEQPIEVKWTVRNAGTGATLKGWVDQLYLSTDEQLDTSDMLVGEYSNRQSLTAGQSYEAIQTVTLPQGIHGAYYVIAVTDGKQTVIEPLAEDNNRRVSSVIDVRLAPYADLAVSQVVAPSRLIGDPAPLPISWTVTNIGTGIGKTLSWQDSVVASVNEIAGDGDDIVLARFDHTNGLAVNATYDRTATVLLPPSLTGRFHLFVQTDRADVVFENHLEINNAAGSPTLLEVMPIAFADLVVSDVAASPLQAKSGQPLAVSWTVANQGIGVTNTNTWSDTVALATDALGQNVVATLGAFPHSGQLDVNGSYARALDVTLPEGIAGTYYVVVSTGGPFEFVYTGNNSAVSSAVQVELTIPPDLTVTDIVGPADSLAGATIDVQWTVRNAGAGNALGRWSDVILLRPTSPANAEPIRLASFDYSTGLAAGISYTRAEQVRLPGTLAGTFQLVVETNRENTLYEHGARANNLLVDDAVFAVVQPTRPDLQVSQLEATPRVSAGGTVSVQFTVINQGTVPTNPPHWSDSVYLSLDNQLTGDDLLIGALENGAALAPGEQYRSTLMSAIVPRRMRGDMFVIVAADSDKRVNETPNENNNTAAVPIHVDGLPPADLVTTSVVAPWLAFDGSSIEVRYTVENLGAAATDATQWVDTVWLTAGKKRPDPRQGDILLAAVPRQSGLAKDESYEQVTQVALPARVGGEYFITVWSDSLDSVTEDTFSNVINPEDPNELDSNNYRSRSITIGVNPPADLVVESVTSPATAVAGSDAPLVVRWSVANRGTEATQSNQWVDQVFLSDQPTLSAGGTVFLLGEFVHSGSLVPGQSYEAQASVLLSPATTGRYVHVRTNVDGAVWEGPFTDNNEASSSTLVTSTPADLRVTSVAASAQNFSGETAEITWTVENFGASVWPGTSYWTDTIFLSQDPSLATGRVVATASFTYRNDSPLGTGEKYSRTQSIALPVGVQGTYYAFVVTDPGSGLVFENGLLLSSFTGRVYEGQNEENNVSVVPAPVPITYREPDLKLVAVTGPVEPALSGQSIDVTWSVENCGDRSTRESFWIDRVYLSRDASLDSSDQQLGEAWISGGLAAGGRYSRSLQVELPDGLAGTFHLLIATDANLTGALPPDAPGIQFDQLSDGLYARVPEFADEGNNLGSTSLTIRRADPPDLQVASVSIPQRTLIGQFFDVTYRVTNSGPGGTPGKQADWDDLVYLSRDQFLDLNADLFLGSAQHVGGLDAGSSYQNTLSVRAPRDQAGAYYVFVVTDPVRYGGRGDVFELDRELNNATASSQPLLIELPPPADLVTESITVPVSATVGKEFIVSYTTANRGQNAANGTWSDAVYLSRDGVWDLSDVLLGRAAYEGLPDPVTHEPVLGPLAPGQSYSNTLRATLPPLTPGSYRIIVRPDTFNEIYEGADEANNRTASTESIQVSVESLQLNVPLHTTLSSSQDRLYQVVVPVGETLRVRLTSSTSQSTNELFLRFGDAPSGLTFDASDVGALTADPVVLLPTTQAGVYYVLVRGVSQPAADTSVSLLADLLPFSITDVSPDRGGAASYVTTTIRGAKFDSMAIVKLVRPGIAEYEPVSYQVLDATRIIATFDLADAPHGLYDIKVTNPGGEVAVIPYRFLVERALEPEIAVGLGGPRIIAPGDVGRFGFSLLNQGNVDLPYVQFQYGVPELGLNGELFDLPYVVMATNLRGSLPIEDVPWASIDPVLNTTGHTLASGYAVDLPAFGLAGLSLNTLTYPGLDEQRLLHPDFDREIDPCSIAFRFHVLASATPLTRQEYVAQQTAAALRIRAGILADPTASPPLRVLAADSSTFVGLYFAALTDAGLLRAEDQTPEVRENPLLVSLTATLAAGLLAGPAGREIISTGDLPAFFAQLQSWYGHDPSQLGSPFPPDRSAFDLGLSARTAFEAFNVYVPAPRCDFPSDANDVPAAAFTRILNSGATSGRLATLIGPLGAGDAQFLPLGQPLPYTIRFESPAGATAPVGELRIVSPLDTNLDPRTFRLGSLQIGDIQVNVPAGRSSFQGEFDFSRSRGFVLRVSGGLDVQTNTVAWQLQAIDPLTGEVVTDGSAGLLPPAADGGSTFGYVTYTVQAKTGLPTGATITAQARVLYDSLAPQETLKLVQQVDGVVPRTTLSVNPVAGSVFEVKWNATDDAAGSGVKGVTVYVSQDGGPFTIWQNQSTATTGTYRGVAGHSYEFLALATDRAGNRETPPAGITTPNDGSGAQLGALPAASDTTIDLGELPAVVAPATNPLFVEAKASIPADTNVVRPADFSRVLRPFAIESYATDFDESHAGIGPMAIVTFPDGTSLISGGTNRSSLYKFSLEGGRATSPLATLPWPVFDLALDSLGRLWATTGGGPLLQIDSTNGAIVQEYGDGLTQALAIDPADGRIYVSSGNGVERFDPVTETFTHFSNTRVGSLAFSSVGDLWGALWPERGEVVRFDLRGKAERQLRFDEPVDSLTFGVAGSQLAGLLFLSTNNGKLILVDEATLNQIVIGSGGSRGDVLRATVDGRLLISQSAEVDVLSPAVSPRVVATNPADQTIVGPPLGQVTVTFSRDMLVAPATNPASVLNPSNYVLAGQHGGRLPIVRVDYDRTQRTATLIVGSLSADRYELRMLTSLKSADGRLLAEEFHSSFEATSDFSNLVTLEFLSTRSNRGLGTVSYDVRVTNTSGADLYAPLQLIVNSSSSFIGQLPAAVRTPGGSFLIDVGAALPDGVLPAGRSTVARTISIQGLDGQRANLEHDLLAVPPFNSAPFFDSDPVTAATAGQRYEYQAVARDLDGETLTYLLYAGPPGMTVDSATGLLSWTVTADASPIASAVLLAVDRRGARATQQFSIHVAGANRPPVAIEVQPQYSLREGEPFELGWSATDPDGQLVSLWADRLPPGASFDAAPQVLTWTPGFQAAGVYSDVRLLASDGDHTVSRTVTLSVANANAMPTLRPVADVVVRQGDPVRIVLRGDDADCDAIEYYSTFLPGGTLDARTGLFLWTPEFFQEGVYRIPFSVRDGDLSATQTASITVLNVNAAPVFSGLTAFEVAENQLVAFRAFAFDPDNPGFIPPDRLDETTLTEIEGSLPSVTYAVSGLPTGAGFDPETGLFNWTPSYAQAGEYVVRVTATDDGDRTGEPKSITVDVPITVRNNNRPPQLPEFTNVSVPRGEVLSIPIVATDADGDPIMLTIAGKPSFATFTDRGDGTGLLRVAPGPRDRGNFSVTLTATDNGNGGGSSQVQNSSQSFVITVEAVNDAPRLDYIGGRVAIVGQTLSFLVAASDVDQDPLSFAAAGLPPGATLTPQAVYGTARFEWTPVAAGSFDVTITATDSGNGQPQAVGSDQQVVRLVARAANAAPVLSLVGDRTVAEGQELLINLSATDADGDGLTYAISKLPPGAEFDARTGILRWTPSLLQAGIYSGIELSVTDGNRSDSESISITVGNSNQAPSFLPQFLQSTRENALLQFTLLTSDFDNDALTITPVTALPRGAVLDSLSGRFQWTPDYDQAGTYDLSLRVRDPGGLTDTASVRITVDNVNRPPTLQVFSHTAMIGRPLEFTAEASDPDRNAVLQFAADGLPPGASLNPETGSFRWTPGIAQAGEYPVMLQVTDGEDVVSKQILLRATANPPLPAVTIELTPSFPVTPGQPVLVHVVASSLAPLSAKTLTVDGLSVTLDSQGRGRFTPDEPGRFVVQATVTDADGLIGTGTATLRVRDPLDSSAPVVELAQSLQGNRVTAPLTLTGSIADTNLDRWTLSIVSLNGTDRRVLAQGDSAIGRGPLATLDPAQFTNGFYLVQLVATDVAGRSSTTQANVEIASQAKSGYRRVENDLDLQLAGQTFSLGRAYDSLAAASSTKFGFGWRLAQRDVMLQTDVPRTGREASGNYSPLQEESRLAVTLPDGQRVGFSFTPTRHELPGLTYYSPHWTADAGVAWTLESTATKLVRGDGKFYDLLTAAPYNPANGKLSGPQYKLTAPDGSVYEISEQRGVERIVLSGGVALAFSDSGVVASTGERIRFETDAAGRLSAITNSAGERVAYRYDAAGNLAIVQQLSTGSVTRYGYTAESHQVAVVTHGTGTGEVFDGSSVSRPLTGDLGTAHQFIGRPTSGTLGAGEVGSYAFVIRDSELASTPEGRVYLSVSLKATSGNLVPEPAVIPGLTPVLSRTVGNRSFALYMVSSPGLSTLQVRGAGAGAYELEMTIVGDVNRDGHVDGIDAQQLDAIVSGGGQDAAADFDGDGNVDITDVQLSSRNFGFVANLPPTISNATTMTHIDLPVTFDLTQLAADPEGDAIVLRIVAAEKGTAVLTGNGRAAVFTPANGASGAASFRVVADDGYDQSSVGIVNVQVSDAPLVRLDFLQRQPRLLVGGTFAAALVGDFADQANVLLPATYATFSSTNVAAATVDANGRLAAVGNGSGAVMAVARGTTAVTAFQVGPYEGLDVLLAASGLVTYPAAVTLAADGGRRQILVTLPDETDARNTATGTTYYVSRPDIVTISGDGLITAVGTGEAVITIVHGLAESLISVAVKTANLGAVMLGERGGVARDSNGLEIAIAPGAIATPVSVEIHRLSTAELPLPVPRADVGFTYGSAFQISTDDQPLDVAAQLAIPMPGLLPGSIVTFYRHALQPNEDGTSTPFWAEEETGVVGTDGIARTSSPPHTGIRQPGTYMAGTWDAARVREMRARLILAFPITAVGAVAMATVPVGGVLIGSIAALGTSLVLSLPFAQHQVKMTVIAPESLPSQSTVGLEVKPGSLGNFNTKINIPNTPQAINKPEPLITFTSIEYPANEGEPVLVIKGRRLQWAAADAPIPPGGDHKLGTIDEDIEVVFFRELVKAEWLEENFIGPRVDDAPLQPIKSGLVRDVQSVHPDSVLDDPDSNDPLDQILRVHVPPGVALGAYKFVVRRMTSKLTDVKSPHLQPSGSTEQRHGLRANRRSVCVHGSQPGQGRGHFRRTPRSGWTDCDQRTRRPDSRGRSEDKRH